MDGTSPSRGSDHWSSLLPAHCLGLGTHTILTPHRLRARAHHAHLTYTIRTLRAHYGHTVYAHRSHSAHARTHHARTPRAHHALCTHALHTARTPYSRRTDSAHAHTTHTSRTPHAHRAHTTHTPRSHRTHTLCTHTPPHAHGTHAHCALFCYYESASEQVRGAPAARAFPVTRPGAGRELAQSSPTSSSSSSSSVYWITNIPERRHKSFYQMKKLGIKEVTWLSIQSKITL
eukprot:XP_022270703.1 histidine-rich protein PFHRP-II-like [Canis lupus familiaris]